MRKLLLILLTVVLIVTAGSAFAEEENLLLNGDFSEVTGADFPVGWYRDMWYADSGISYLQVSEESMSGFAVEVFNADENDARWAQNVAVEPDTVYRLSAMVRTQSVGEFGAGANISFGDAFCMTEAAGDTYGDWEQLELYGRTAPDQTELRVFLRVGGYGSLNSGRAWFDDVSLVKVENVPLTAMVYDLTPQTASAQEEVEFGFADENEPVRHTETSLLLIGLYVLLIVAVYVRRERMPGDGREKFYGRLMFAALVLAMLVRVFLAATVRGHYTDVGCFSAWSERIFSTSLANFYEEGYFCDYPPGYMLLLWPVALLRNIFGLSTLSGAYYALLKFLPMACDLAGAYLVWRCAKEKLGVCAAFLLAAFYAFNPATVVNSAAWGQIDSVFTLVIVVCALLALKGRYRAALPVFAAALLIKPQALLLAPLGLLAAVVDCIVRVKKSGEKKHFVRLTVGAGLALLTMYAVALPFSLNKSDVFVLFRPVKWLWELYSGTLSGYRYVTVNALNLYCALGMNWVSPDQVFVASSVTAAWNFAWVMFIVSHVYAVAMLAVSRDSKKFFLTGGLLMLLIYAFGPMMHERYAFPALLMLAFAYALERDRRVLWSLVAATVGVFMNTFLVLQGGMTAGVDGNFMGHLQSSEQWLNTVLSVMNVANALFLAWTAFDLCALKKVKLPVSLVCAFFREKILQKNEKPEQKNEKSASKTKNKTEKKTEVILNERIGGEEPHRYKMGIRCKDVLLMAAVTLVYAVLAFVNLGSTKAPQTAWVAGAGNEAVVFDLGQERTFRMTYYGGISSTHFTVELSKDGESWTEPCHAQYNEGEIFRWLWYVPKDAALNTVWQGAGEEVDGVRYASVNEMHPMQTARYVRLTALSAGLTLHEVAFLDDEGTPFPVGNVTSYGGTEGYVDDPNLLIDEQDTVPAYPSYFNSSYFDEIYHARTAYEHAHGMYSYEWTHPPLGKVLMMVGIKLFGMTPFGWRFMGALMGVMMLPLMYLLTKQLTKRRDLSFIAMALMALDSMHFTQTRIATIDSYAVFFIMLMYLFMARYWQMDWRRDGLLKTLVPLGLCGVTMGVAWATKWIGIYASAGLALLFAWTVGMRIRDHRQAKDPKFWRNLLVTVGFCLVFFVVIPVLIYYFSYYWHLQYEGGLSVSKVVQLQKDIFGYHAGLNDSHSFNSPWYQWPVIAWPMWFYSGTEYLAPGMISSISCMGNPAVWWTGLAAILFVLFRAAFSKKADKVSLFILIGFASQYMPWVLVPRSTFIYHYFASVPFIILATVTVLDRIRVRRSRNAMWAVAGVLLFASAFLFAMFYPLESGAVTPRWYANLLRWFNWYNF